MYKCILPFSKCPYLDESYCSDIIDGPYNSDAKCYRISGKKKMLRASRFSIAKNIYEPLHIRATRNYNNITRTLEIFIGEKHVATLVWEEPLLSDCPPNWWLDNEIMGTNEIDAVQKTLEKLGFSRK